MKRRYRETVGDINNGIVVYVTDEIYENVRNYAFQTRMSHSEVVRIALVEFFEYLNYSEKKVLQARGKKEKKNNMLYQSDKSD